MSKIFLLAREGWQFTVFQKTGFFGLKGGKSLLKWFLLCSHLDVAGKHGNGHLGLSCPQGIQYGSVSAVGRSVPFCPPSGKQKARTRGVQIINCLEQAWHCARGENDPMEGPVGILPCLDILGLIGSPIGILCLLENSLGEMRDRIAQGQRFESGPHLGHLPDFFEAESCNANASARLAHDKPLRFQTPKCLTHRDMARAEFFGNMILPEPGARFQRPGNNPVGQRLADPNRNCVVFRRFHVL